MGINKFLEEPDKNAGGEGSHAGGGGGGGGGRGSKTPSHNQS